MSFLGDLIGSIPIVGPAISAVGSLFNDSPGQVATTAAQIVAGNETNATNQAIAQQTSAFNAAEAEKNRQFQQYNSDTSIQRRTADMRAAGLNPILAAGEGASSPAGSTASGVSSHVENVISPALTSAFERHKLAADTALTEGALTKQEREIENLAETGNNIVASTAKQMSDISLNAAQIEAIRAGIPATKAVETRTKQETAHTAAMTDKARTEAEVARAEAASKKAAARNEAARQNAISPMYSPKKEEGVLHRVGEFFRILNPFNHK